jgi:UDP-3-O-[3-hydroxymyristoyl] glucosamine N-acyltransferase
MVLLKDVISLLDSVKVSPGIDLDQEILGIASLDQAKSGQLSFLSSAKFRRHLTGTQASVVMVTEKELANCPDGVNPIVVNDPYVAYAKVSQLFDLTPEVQPGIHETAVIDPTSTIGGGVRIGANAYIAAGVVLEDKVQVGANSVVDEHAIIGTGTVVGFNVTVGHRCEIGQYCLIQHGSVIGSKGFGYAPTESGWEPIAQLGRVIIGNRVEMGANCTVDRGAIRDTVINDDVIIDNLVHVAHNVSIGHKTAIAAQVGIAGSTQIGKNCTFGGQVGVTGHIDIADQSFFTGQAMVTKGTKEAGIYSSGLPAQDAKEWRKMVARIRQLESMQQRLKELENKLSSEESE